MQRTGNTTAVVRSAAVGFQFEWPPTVFPAACFVPAPVNCVSAKKTGWTRLALRSIPYTTDPLLGLARLSQEDCCPSRGSLIEHRLLVVIG